MRFCFNSTSFLLIIPLNLLLRVYGAGQNKTESTNWSKNRQQWPTPNYSLLLGLRQGPQDQLEGFTAPGGLGGPKQGGKAEEDALRFSTKSTTVFRKKRSTKEYVSLNEHCDYLALNCLRSYQTGRVCARAGYWRYFTFKNYCMMDFVNCRSRYETWTIIHMGDCLWIKPISEYFAEDYRESGMMDGYYVLDREN